MAIKFHYNIRLTILVSFLSKSTIFDTSCQVISSFTCEIPVTPQKLEATFFPKTPSRVTEVYQNHSYEAKNENSPTLLRSSEGAKKSILAKQNGGGAGNRTPVL